MTQYDPRGPRQTTATKVRQGGAQSMTLWILLVSVLLAALVGFMLLTNTDEFPPSTQRNPVENAPVSGSQSSPPQAEPQTKQ